MRWSCFLLLLLSQSQSSFEHYAQQTLERYNGLPKQIVFGKTPGFLPVPPFSRAELAPFLDHQRADIRAMAYCILLNREPVEAWWPILDKGLDDTETVEVVGGCSPMTIGIDELLLCLYEEKQPQLGPEQLRRLLTLSPNLKARNRMLMAHVPETPHPDLAEAIRHRVWQGDWAPLILLARMNLPEDDDLLLAQLQLLQADSDDWLHIEAVLEAIHLRPNPQHVPELLRLWDELPYRGDSPLRNLSLFRALAQHPNSALDQRFAQLLTHQGRSVDPEWWLKTMSSTDFPVFRETLFLLLEQEQATRADMFDFLLKQDYERAISAFAGIFGRCYSSHVPSDDIQAIYRRLLSEPSTVHEPIFREALRFEEDEPFVDLVALMKSRQPDWVREILTIRLYQDRSWNRDDIHTVETLVALDGLNAIATVEQMILDEDRWWETKRAKLPVKLRELHTQLEPVDRP